MIPPERHARHHAPMAGAGGDETREGAVAAGDRTAQAPACGGAPCSLDDYATIHAEMACRKDPQGDPIHYLLVLAEHGMAQPRWLQCEGYWMPRVGVETILGAPNPQFDPVQALRFRALLRQASDRVHPTVD